MKVFVCIAFCLLTVTAWAQNDSDDIDNHIHLLTTIVRGQLGVKTTQGTGFFYMVLDSTDTTGWRKVQQTWLITNRHLVFFQDRNGKEEPPQLFTFYLRKVDNNSLKWLPVQISQDELKKRLRIYGDSTIDVAAIQIGDLGVAEYRAVSEEDFPGKVNKLYSHVTDDVVVVGYPMEFYDDVHLFPMVKSGIISSKWGIGFKNNPYFLIDAKLFPGSSGSIVISKPTNTTIDKGQQQHKTIFFSRNILR